MQLTMEQLTTGGVVISALGFVAVVVGLGLTYSQMKRYHEWNRRKASFDLTLQIATGDVRQIIQRLLLDYGVDMSDPAGGAFDTVVASLDATRRRAFDVDLRVLMNCFETIALGVKHNILDEDICYEHVSLVLTNTSRWADPFIRQKQRLDPTVWIECVHFAKRWSARQEREIAVLRTQGKPKT